MFTRGKDVARILFLAALVVVGAGCCGQPRCPFAGKQAAPIKVVVLTGGHSFEHDPFFTLFQGQPDIQCTEFALKDDSEIFEDINGWDYDVIVLYNMGKNISPRRQQNFVKLLGRGVGLVALHHSMVAWPQWDEYPQIIGTKYFETEGFVAGRQHTASSYLHDVDMPIRVADKKHRVTRGIDDFQIHDETYKNCWFADDNHALLTTDHPTSDRTVAWTRNFGRARVCTIQLGHGPEAYANPSYRRLVANAIRWTADRLE